MLGANDVNETDPRICALAKSTYHTRTTVTDGSLRYKKPSCNHHQLIHHGGQSQTAKQVSQLRRTPSRDICDSHPAGKSFCALCVLERAPSKQRLCSAYSDGGEGHFFLYMLPSARLYDIILTSGKSQEVS